MSNFRTHNPNITQYQEQIEHIAERLEHVEHLQSVLDVFVNVLKVLGFFAVYDKTRF